MKRTSTLAFLLLVNVCSCVLLVTGKSILFDIGATCASEKGPHSIVHEHYLNRLDGKRIVFIGDSITRYQYLELAYYLTRGKCPDPQDEGYILSEAKHASWRQFYKASSSALNLDADNFNSRELCLCSRTDLAPGKVMEERTFTYTDVQVYINGANR
jgi:hypothetical protein